MNFKKEEGFSLEGFTAKYSCEIIKVCIYLMLLYLFYNFYSVMLGALWEVK